MGGAALTGSGEERPPIPSGPFGLLCFGFLGISLVSGGALAVHYDPAAPLASLERIVGGIPLGWFLRTLHGWSSFACLGALIVHVGAVLWKKTETSLSPGVWWRSVALVPLVGLALFGGFVMKGDAEARAAADVGQGLLRSLPIVGSSLTMLLFGANRGSLGVVALHHAGTISILLLLFTIEHAGRVWPGGRPITLAALLSGAAAGLLPLPLGSLSPSAGILLGPWALVGLQGMLLDLPTIFGWLVPALLVLVLGSVRGAPGRWRTLAVMSLVGLSGLWIAWTVRLLMAARS
jgi:ubiquinol-cytochrome c reductase cytochrome b subunit